MVYTRSNLADGIIEEHDGINTVGELRQLIVELPEDMRVCDFWGNALDIVIARPHHLKPYVEVQ